MTRQEIAKSFGFTLRSAPDGDFISQGGDDLMKVTGDGKIIVYSHDANAFYVATMISQAPR